ncbi:Serine hydrolase FSH [Penicillium expansum]|uniref:Serine hydrolase cnsH n=1 Tax=Penicillium expansum TaxID=27334 RepID=CNSH_PENEN|nr:Serine hydrolase FSH [Penicillium expansum]A0A0A2JY30.1 RecName: Full=Serine hydrolase cnsH; AltName: Full=Communesin biosynthesis cluster protein H [Penicillium expansum]KGO40477.1 Serine hydrolase FSH [Penicillium expansum]KGO50069.1 Serine hydrolase FSH [Penicillium expansum]KGO59701.1 Serine hydrolase FSH [Penicillium expansum]
MWVNTLRCPEGIEKVFPGPFACYNRLFDPGSQLDSYALIEETLHTYGPFDGAFGFSQGAALIVSYLLERRAAYPDESLPFRFLILCSPVVPLAGNAEYCHRILGCLSRDNESRIRSCQDTQISDLPERARIAMTMLTDILDASTTITQEPRRFYLDRELPDVPCALHPDLCLTRLPVATLHVRGTTDAKALWNCGFLIQSFFDSPKLRVFEHKSGHDIPRSGPEVRQMLCAMEWIIAQSELP